jgi:hypothetical protein
MKLNYPNLSHWLESATKSLIYSTLINESKGGVSKLAIRGTFLVLSLLMSSMKVGATTCADATVIDPANLPNAQALVCGTSNDVTSSNTANCGNGNYRGGLEALYVFTPNTSGPWNISYSGETWSGIFVYAGCPTSGGTCVANITSSGPSKNLNATLTAGVTYYIMFDTWPTPASPCAGTFTITPPPSCFVPTSVSVSNILQTSARLNYTVNTNNTGSVTYEYEIRSSGAAGSGATGLEQTGTSTGLFANVSGLVAGATYNAYVRTVCGGTNGNSDWSDTIPFTTLCAPQAAPYFEGFESSTTSANPCWTQEKTVGNALWTYDAGAFGGSITAAQAGTKNAMFVSTSGTNTPATLLVSPMIDITTLTDPRLEFWYGQEEWFGDQNELKVYYRTHPLSTWTLLAHYTGNVSTWTRERITLPTTVFSTTFQIGFEGINNYGHRNVIDNVVIESTPDCFSPDPVTASAFNDTNVRVSWTNPSIIPGLGYEVEVRTPGSVPGTATGLLHRDTTALGAIGDTAFGMPVGTQLEVFVRALCAGGNVGPWVSTSAYLVPVIMVGTTDVVLDFDTSDWFFVSGSNSSWERGIAAGSTITPTSFSASPAWITNLDGQYNGSESSFLTSPIYNFTNHSVGEVVVKFDSYMDLENAYDGLWLEISTNGGQSWTKVANNPTALNWYNGQGNGSSFSGPAWTNNIGKKLNSIEFDSLAGKPSVQFRYALVTDPSVNREGVGIDNFTVVPPPPCPKPLGMIDTATSFNGTVSWTSSSNTSTSHIIWGPAGFLQGSGGFQNGTVVNGATSPYTITGMNPSTLYHVYLIDTCGVDTSSVLVGPMILQTLRAPLDVKPTSLNYQACGDSTTSVNLTIANSGLDTAFTFPVELKVYDNVSGTLVATLNGVYQDTIAPQGSDEIVLGSFNTYLGGTFDFKAQTSLVGDTVSVNDSLWFMNKSFIPAMPVVGLTDTVCGNLGLVTLSVPSSIVGQTMWYLNLNDTVAYANAESINVPTNGQQTYYAEYSPLTLDSLATPLNVNNDGGNGAANYFNIVNKSSSPLTIRGFAQGPAESNTSAANVNVEVYYMTSGYQGATGAASWTLAGSATTNLTAGKFTGFVPVAVVIPANATYGFAVRSVNASQGYANGTGTAGVTPLVSNSLFDLTMGHAGVWPIQSFQPRNWNGQVYWGEDYSCANAVRVPVSFALNPDTALASFTATETNAATGTFTFDGSASNGSIYNWSFGDGYNFSGAATTVHSYASNGNYTATLAVYNATCDTWDTTTTTITPSIGFVENGLPAVARVFPSPSNGAVTVEYESRASGDVVLTIVNSLGQVLHTTNMLVVDGTTSTSLDLSHLPKGLYTVVIDSESGSVNARLILQ